MGRKGMKGFMKSASRASSKPDEEVAGQPSSSTAEQPAHSAAAPSSSKPQPVAADSAANGTVEGAEREPGDSSKQESRGQMLQRHKREMLAHKKAVQRTGKKSKDELSKLDAEIEARHAQELQQLDTAAAASTGSSSQVAPAAAQAAAAVDGTAGEADRASKYLMDLSLGIEEVEVADDQKADKKVTKAQKRREKQAAKHAEREARIAAEQAALGPSERQEEEKALKELLQPLGLGIKEIRADGHCLYRSVEDQLEAAAAGGEDNTEEADLPDYQQLRELAAKFIREHKDDFAPFLLPDDEESNADAHFEQYCSTIESTAAWGGHVELQALSHALKRQIKIHAVGMATQSLGDEYAGDGKPPALEVCYLQHAFGLGEHYNSTKKQRFVRFSTDNDYFEHEGDVDSENGQGSEEQEDAGKPDS